MSKLEQISLPVLAKVNFPKTREQNHPHRGFASIMDVGTPADFNIQPQRARTEITNLPVSSHSNLTLLGTVCGSPGSMYAVIEDNEVGNRGYAESEIRFTGALLPVFLEIE